MSATSFFGGPFFGGEFFNGSAPAVIPLVGDPYADDAPEMLAQHDDRHEIEQDDEEIISAVLAALPRLMRMH